MQDIEALKTELMDRIRAAADLAGLEDVRIGALGRKGSVTQLVKGLGAMAPEDRKAAGQAFNALKTEVVDLAMLAAEKVSQKSLDDEDHRRLIQEAIEQADLSSLKRDES